ncbi:MAG: 4-hydroxythreonine-4-phosphate dehydrogenase PdxA [Lachnospiraceae bacterium]|nr:4-hydroxythreonine-4-phosphate dehydrogenase PdxA [Lachnospiraceae bacterium]
MEKPLLAVTMGDAAGIGPEITCKALARPEIYRVCRPIVLGDIRIIRHIIERCNLPLKTRCISKGEGGDTFGTVDVVDYGNIDMSDWEFGRLSKSCGEAAVHYTREACQMCMEGTADAMVSAPLNKAAMRMAGYHYEGQTQIVGEMTGSANYGMLLLLGDMRVLMYSNHCSLEEACQKVKKETVYEKIMLVHEGLRKITALYQPVIAVSALNPHCGEEGMFGRQELDEIIPGIQQAKLKGVQVTGPVPADTVFVEAQKGTYDAVIAMYHDQANMAMKLLGFGSVVTLLVGVPVIRTSTGHGTAFNIAGQNLANEENLYQAILEAAKLAAFKKA